MDFSLFPIPLLFAVTITVCFGFSFFTAYFGKRMAKTAKDHNLYSGVTSILAAVVLFVLSGFDTSVSWFTVGLSALFGLVTMVYTLLQTYALSIGPWSYTTVLISFSTVITALSGFFFFGETLSPLKLVGIALMAVCFVLSVKKEEGEHKKASLRWVLICLIAMCCSAGIGMLQKTHQSSLHKAELNMFLVISFLFAAVFSAVMYVWNGKKEKSMVPMGIQSMRRLPAILAVVVGLAGVCLALNHMINLYLSGVVDSAIFFPIVNGANLMLNILGGLIIFREKLSPRQWVGLVFGCAATLVLCL